MGGVFHQDNIILELPSIQKRVLTWGGEKEIHFLVKN
jgi:hypothetical protein